MHRFFGEYVAYDLFNSIAIYVTLILSLFCYKSKLNAMGLYSRYAVFFLSRKNYKAGKFFKYFLAFVELFLITLICIASVLFNYPFGELVGTGVNYFGGLYALPILMIVFSVVIMANPMKQMDIVTFLLPMRLFFLKLACFFNGCCWGIPWEYGPYNYHYDHPGNQVPVQAIEAFWALAIFVFFLWYRKKAKEGTMYPMYLILYSATRFCSEFLRREENVLWIFKTYHLLCMAGFVIGLILFFIARKYGDKISDFFDKPHKKFDLKIAQYEEQLSIEAEQKRLAEEAAEAERKEKARQFRNRAKARLGKKIK